MDYALYSSFWNIYMIVKGKSNFDWSCNRRVVNSMLLNVEAWHNVLKKDLSTFTNMDKYLVQKIVNSHS